MGVVGASAIKALWVAELPMERGLSQEIGAMPFVCLPVEDQRGPDSARWIIERARFPYSAIKGGRNVIRHLTNGSDRTALAKNCARPGLGAIITLRRHIILHS